MVSEHCPEARGPPRRACSSTFMPRGVFLVLGLLNAVPVDGGRSNRADFPAAKQAISAGLPVDDHLRKLDVATPGMVVGASCSPSDPCWVVLPSTARGEEARLTIADGSSTLASQDSIGLLTLYSGAKVAHANFHGAKGQGIRPEVLRVLDVVAPNSYFFAYAYENKLHALSPSDPCRSIATAGRPPLPAFDRFPHLDVTTTELAWGKDVVVVLRRPGMRLLGLAAVGSAAQLLRDEEFRSVSPVPLATGGCAWSNIDPEARRKAREAVEATGDAQLLVDGAFTQPRSSRVGSAVCTRADSSSYHPPRPGASRQSLSSARSRSFAWLLLGWVERHPMCGTVTIMVTIYCVMSTQSLHSKS